MLKLFWSPFGTLIHALFGLEGRITRELWWIGMALVWTAYFWLVRGITHYAEYEIGLYPNPILHERIELIALLIMVYPTLALCQKRLHDRGWGVGGILVLAFLPYAAVVVAQAGFHTPLEARQDLSMIVHYSVLAISALAVVEMAVLMGQERPNQHGPDPRANASAEPLDATPQPIKAAMIRARAAQEQARLSAQIIPRSGLSPSPAATIPQALG